MPVVRFAWDPQLVDREVCPLARWSRSARAWSMTAGEADLFVQAAHIRRERFKASSEIAIHDDQWLIGFVRGAPCRR